MLKVRVDSSYQKAVQDALEREAVDELNKLVDEIVLELIQATPKETGYAASRWSRDSIFNTLKDIVGIENDADYIRILNDGHSKQAPKYFIQQVVFRLTGQLPR